MSNTVITLKDFQQTAVDNVVNTVKDFLSQPANESKVIVLHSPTGSGKTVMLGHILDRSLSESLTIVLGPGSGDLETQTCNRLKSVCKNVIVKELDSTILNTPAFAGLAVVSNWEALTTRDRKTGEYKVSLTKDSENINFFDWIMAAAAKGIQVSIIVDEAHHGATKTAAGIKSFLDDIAKSLIMPSESGTVIASPLYIEASATPLRTDAGEVNHFRKITVTHDKVIAAGLMRKNGALNAGIRASLAKMSEEERGNVGSEMTLLKGAWDQLNLINAEYEKVGSKYHALLAIQIPNLAAGKDAIERAKKFFLMHDVSEANGRLAVFMSDTKTADIADIASPDSPIQVLLYKQAIATGWDCPRAQILVGFRHISSKIFTIQNLGRIARTTEAKHYGNDILDTFYIYSNINDLGLETFQDAVVDGLPEYATWGNATTENIAEFNSLNLPYFTFDRALHNGLDNSVLRNALKKALLSNQDGRSFSSLYSYVDASEIESSMFEVHSSAVSILSGIADVDSKKVTTKGIGESSDAVQRNLLNMVEAVVTEKGRDFGANRRVTETIVRQLVLWMQKACFDDEGSLRVRTLESIGSEAEKEDNFVSNDWVALQLIENFLAVKKVINTALADEIIATMATKGKAKTEDVQKSEVRKLRFIGSYALPRVVVMDHVNEKVVPNNLAPFYLYNEEQRTAQNVAKAWRNEVLWLTEETFENGFLGGVVSGDIADVKLGWFYKNPPRNDNDFSLALTSGGLAIPWFPDYIVKFIKNGVAHFAIIEVKPENIDGMDVTAQAKAKAGLAYSEKTGIPCVVVYAINGQFRVAGTDTVTTLSDFLFKRDWKAQTMPNVARTSKQGGEVIPSELEWIKSL